jgi:YidC/Oxa1 family membrane protein insertase
MEILNTLFGAILNVIFDLVEIIAPIGTLGIAIIIFTLVTRLLMTPLQLKQQRTTRIMSKLQPEMQKLQKKYENKKDQASQMQYSQELQGLYKKYNISPLSGCLPLLIQLPLIYALFNVLRTPSKYISELSDIYTGLGQIIVNKVANYQGLLMNALQQVGQASTVAYDLTSLTSTDGTGSLPQFLSQLNTQQWADFMLQVPTEVQNELTILLERKQNAEWFIFNLVDTPQHLVSTGTYLAIIIPIIAGLSTFIFSKITMASSQAMQSGANAQANSAESTMKVMNIMMPIMMGFFSYTVPTGLALYWISGNVIMMGQQVWVNKIVTKQERAFEEQLRKEREAKKSTTKKKKKTSIVNNSEPVQESEKVIEQDTSAKKKKPKPQSLVDDTIGNREGQES